MTSNQQPSRIRRLADAYRQVTGEHVYSGAESGIGRKGHYFSDAFIVGDDQALAHMIMLCQRAGVDTKGI